MMFSAIEYSPCVQLAFLLLDFGLPWLMDEVETDSNLVKQPMFSSFQPSLLLILASHLDATRLLAIAGKLLPLK